MARAHTIATITAKRVTTSQLYHRASRNKQKTRRAWKTSQDTSTPISVLITTLWGVAVTVTFRLIGRDDFVNTKRCSEKYRNDCRDAKNHDDKSGQDVLHRPRSFAGNTRLTATAAFIHCVYVCLYEGMRDPRWQVWSGCPPPSTFLCGLSRRTCGGVATIQ